MLPNKRNENSFNFKHEGRPDAFGASMGNYIEVQRKFDSRALDNMEAINELIEALEANSASESIGTPFLTFNPGDSENVESQLNSLDTAIGGRVYSEENYVVNLQSVTDSLEAIDVHLGSITTLLNGYITSNDLRSTAIEGVNSSQQTQLDNKPDRSEILTKTNTTAYEPTTDYHPATRKFVIDNASSGGMPIATYDPQSKQDDAFHMDNMTEGTDTKVFTAGERTKLQGIQTGAQVNTVNSVNTKTGAVTLNNEDVGLGNVDNVKQAPHTHVGSVGDAHGVATLAEAGFMSHTDKSKLNSLTAHNVYSFGPFTSGTTVTLPNRTYKVSVYGYVYKQTGGSASLNITVSGVSEAITIASGFRGGTGVAMTAQGFLEVTKLGDRLMGTRRHQYNGGSGYPSTLTEDTVLVNHTQTWLSSVQFNSAGDSRTVLILAFTR